MNARWKRIAGARVRVPALAAVLAASSIAAGAAVAAEPELIGALRANGAQIVSLGSRGGLDGYFVTPAKAGGYSLYVTGDGHAVAGLLYGPNGAEITGAQLAAAHAGEAPASATGPGAHRSGAERTAVAHAATEGFGAPSSSS